MIFWKILRIPLPKNTHLTKRIFFSKFIISFPKFKLFRIIFVKPAYLFKIYICFCEIFLVLLKFQIFLELFKIENLERAKKKKKTETQLQEIWKFIWFLEEKFLRIPPPLQKRNFKILRIPPFKTGKRVWRGGYH